MQLDPQKYHRQSIRVRGYDYSQTGAYFVTIVAHGRACIFGEIRAGEMCLSEFGHIVQDTWFDLPLHYPHIELGAFCLMPNHIHGIIIIKEAACEGGSQTRPYGHPLSEIVRAFKTFSAKGINALRDTPGTAVWQRNYYEHILRDDEDHNRIFNYIQANVENWPMDEENPSS